MLLVGVDACCMQFSMTMVPTERELLAVVPMDTHWCQLKGNCSQPFPWTPTGANWKGTARSLSHGHPLVPTERELLAVVPMDTHWCQLKGNWSQSFPWTHSLGLLSRFTGSELNTPTDTAGFWLGVVEEFYSPGSAFCAFCFVLFVFVL